MRDFKFWHEEQEADKFLHALELVLGMRGQDGILQE